MLEIQVESFELYDEKAEEFISVNGRKIVLEHSLISLSKWESKWQKAFLRPKQKMSVAETISYIRCMTISQNVNPFIYSKLYSLHLKEIFDYIENPMTATTFRKSLRNTINRETITAELIYYWMTAFNIPFSCERWHLNRLITLITVCNLKQQPKKKMTRAELLKRNHDLNKQRLERLKTTG